MHTHFYFNYFKQKENILLRCLLCNKKLKKIINAKNGVNLTPLFITAMTGNDPVLKLLIQEGAELDTKSNVIKWPLRSVLRTPNLDDVCMYVCIIGSVSTYIVDTLLN